MMNKRVALCLDGATCRNPQVIGLGGEAIDSQQWLAVYTEGEPARRAIGESGAFDEAWVVSCDDVEPINLAATMKGDRPEMRVYLVAAERCGSLLSRAHTAGIDEVIDLTSFLRRYAETKNGGLSQALGQNSPAQTPATGEGRATQTRTTGQLFSQAAARLLGKKPQGEMAWPQLQPEIQASSSGAVQGGDVSAVPGSAHEPASSSSVPKHAMNESPAFGQPQLAASQQESVVPSASAYVIEEPAVLPTAQALSIQPQPGALATGVGSRAFVMTVVSGSGGAGKSAVSALGALVARARGNRTLLLDCDLQFGDVASMVDAKGVLSVDEAIDHPDRLEQEMALKRPFDVLSAPARLEAAERVVHHLPALLDRLALEYDVVVVNTGASWAEQHAVLLERSSVALFLVDQRVSSIRACQHALDLCARCGIATGPFRFALNRCSKNAPLSSADVSCVLQGMPVYELKDGGRDVEDYLSGGAADELLQIKNEFAKSVEHVMELVLPAGGSEVGSKPAEPEDRRMIRRRGRHGSKKRGW